jgi:hypothetical protein
VKAETQSLLEKAGRAYYAMLYTAKARLTAAPIWQERGSASETTNRCHPDAERSGAEETIHWALGAEERKGCSTPFSRGRPQIRMSPPSAAPQQRSVRARVFIRPNRRCVFLTRYSVSFRPEQLFIVANYNPSFPPFQQLSDVALCLQKELP